jgi:DivIVA domain-containing protein
MGLDRDDIERRDFPTARRGYDPEAVDSHLRRVADELERLGRPAPAPPQPGLAAGASEQVRAILEAAEASAGELRAEAGAEARGHVERVEGAANEMVARLGALQGELDRLLGALKASASVLSEGLLDMRARVEEMGGSVEVPEVPEAPTAGASGARTAAEAREAGQSGAAAAAGAERPGAEEPPPQERAAAPTARSTDEEGARLAALNLALGGTPREEAERYLAEHFDLADPAALLDDVYARVGR